MLTRSIAKRIVQGGNSIGGAISDDGKLIAVSNYEPGGVKVFDAETLDQIADIPAGRQDHRSCRCARPPLRLGDMGDGRGLHRRFLRASDPMV